MQGWSVLWGRFPNIYFNAGKCPDLQNFLKSPNPPCIEEVTFKNVGRVLHCWYLCPMSFRLTEIAQQGNNGVGSSCRSGMGSNGVTVTKFLQLLMILELNLELSYFLSQMFIAVTVTEVTKVPKFLTW